MIKLYTFKSRGVGVITTEIINENSFIGNYMMKDIRITSNSRLVYDGWIETNPIGRYLNHNITPNCFLKKIGNSLKLYSNKPIDEFTELTVNYFEVADRINLPTELYLKYNITNFNYELEPINKVVNLI